MQFEINLTQQGEDAKVEVVHTCTLEIDSLASAPTLGLSLAQGKSVLKQLQAAVLAISRTTTTFTTAACGGSIFVTGRCQCIPI